jgi:small-conductance mechanosensitive channel
MDEKSLLRDVLDVLEYRLFTLGHTPVNLATLLIAVMVVVLALWMSFLAQRGLRRFFYAKGVRDETSLRAASRLIHYTVVAVGIAVAIHTLGVNLTGFFAAGAVFGVGLGFAMQNIIQNFVSGVILIVERSIKPGDILEVENRMVRVIELGARTTVVHTFDEEDMIVPNSLLVQSTVKNYTLRDSMYRLKALIGVAYGSDMDLVKRVLEDATRALPWRAQSRKPLVLMDEFGGSSVNFEVSVWVEDPWQARGLKSQLNETVWWALKNAGVTIAFPQLDVHFDGSFVESLSRR